MTRCPQKNSHKEKLSSRCFIWESDSGFLSLILRELSRVKRGNGSLNTMQESTNWEKKYEMSTRSQTRQRELSDKNTHDICSTKFEALHQMTLLYLLKSFSMQWLTLRNIIKECRNDQHFRVQIIWQLSMLALLLLVVMIHQANTLLQSWLA